MTKRMVLEYICILMEIDIKVILNKERNSEKESIIMQMEINMRVFSFIFFVLKYLYIYMYIKRGLVKR
jgi:hypothetical protein